MGMDAHYTNMQIATSRLIRSCFGGLGLVEVAPDGFGGFAVDDGGEGLGCGLLHVSETAEMREQALACLAADSGNVEQFGIAVAHGAALAMVADGKAMAFVTDHLHEMQHGRTAVEDNWFVFVTVEVDDFLFFGDGGEGLLGGSEGFERFGCCVELTESAVDEDEGGHGGWLFAGFSVRG